MNKIVTFFNVFAATLAIFLGTAIVGLYLTFKLIKWVFRGIVFVLERIVKILVLVTKVVLFAAIPAALIYFSVKFAKSDFSEPLFQHHNHQNRVLIIEQPVQTSYYRNNENDQKWQDYREIDQAFRNAGL